jgi:hypothetical protein
MDERHRRLYASLGYTGPAARIDLTPSEINLEKISAVPEMPPAAPGVDGGTVPAVEASVRIDPAEVPPLSPEGADELEEALNSDPEGTLAGARKLLDENLTEAELRARIEGARMALRSPETAVPAIEAVSAHLAAANPLPDGFTFEGMDLTEIPIDPGDSKFESSGDWLGWMVGAGPFLLTSASKAKFRWHNSPEHAGSGFTYPLDEPGAAPLRVALVSDFGTGRYHSRYIAKQLRAQAFPCAFHLGDVYYAGRRSEFEDYFAAPLDPILGHTQLFALNSNHEMYSGGRPFFEFMDRRRASHPGMQKQEGSYFCLRSSKFQIVGIDTAYHSHGRHKEPALLEWLAKTLSEGKDEGRANILLSADHPYKYESDDLTQLLRKDLRQIVDDRLVDLWFWGNTHYCALYDRGPATQFVGSCIGHGGYPYERQKVGKKTPAPMRFLETAARFPDWTGLRKDRGNNGYCVMSLAADGSVGLSYVDWMGRPRCEATLARSAADGSLQLTSVTLGAD